MEDRQKAVERREREVREMEKKAAELEQAVNEREQGLDQRSCESEERSKRVEELEEQMETFSQLGGLDASTLALGSNYGPLLFFDLSSFAYWVTRHLHSSLAPALPAF